MEDIFHSIVLAIIQGLTEFLPVSSSAHLILFPKFFGWHDQGLAFDVAIHMGTLVSVVTYFRKDLKKIILKEHKLAWAIIGGTIPVGLAGLLLHDYIAYYLRDLWVIATTTIIFGILLGVASVVGRQTRNEHQINWSDVIVIGCAQALALIPGTSRSGITLTAGMLMGFSRTAAARFSFLLSIPVITLAALFESYKLYKSPAHIDYSSLYIGFIVAAISGYLCIDLFLRLIQKYGVMPFVVYRLILGCVLVLVLI